MRRDVLFMDGQFVETRREGADFSFSELGGDGRSEVFHSVEVPGIVNGVEVPQDWPEPRTEEDE